MSPAADSKNRRSVRSILREGLFKNSCIHSFITLQDDQSHSTTHETAARPNVGLAQSKPSYYYYIIRPKAGHKMTPRETEILHPVHQNSQPPCIPNRTPKHTKSHTCRAPQSRVQNQCTHTQSQHGSTLLPTHGSTYE